MTSKRDLIRWFITEMAWATPQNVTYFLEGRCNDKLERVYSSELSEMLKVKASALRLRRIKNQDDKFAYTRYAKALPTYPFNHDVCLRNVIGKFLHDGGRHKVSFRKPADASILHYRFELDNGHMDDKQLKEKIETHYRDGNIQVVFIMRHREFPYLEEGRLKKIFEISDNLFYGMPNRILGACYSKYLENGKLYNRKGDERWIKTQRSLHSS